MAKSAASPSGSSSDEGVPARRTRSAIAREKQTVEGDKCLNQSTVPRKQLQQSKKLQRVLRVRTSTNATTEPGRVTTTLSATSPNGQRLKLKLRQPAERRIRPVRLASQNSRVILDSSDSEVDQSQISSSECSPQISSSAESDDVLSEADQSSKRKRASQQVCPHLEDAEDDCELEHVMETIARFNSCVGGASTAKGKTKGIEITKSTKDFVCGYRGCRQGIHEGLSLCVTCGKVFCRNGKHHAQIHQATASHAIVLDLTSKECFCYSCDSVVSSTDELISGFGKKLATIDESNYTNGNAINTVIADDAIEPRMLKVVAVANSKSTSKVVKPKRKRTRTATKPRQKAKPKDIPVEIPIPPGAMGLSNMGNSCFMNSVIQALSNTYIFREAVLRDTAAVADFSPPQGAAPSTPRNSEPKVTESALSPRYLHTLRSDPQDVSLYVEWVGLIKALWQHNAQEPWFVPASFFSSVARVMPSFGDLEQHDAHEFLRYLCDRLHWECTVTGPARGVRAGNVTPPPRISHEENKDSNLSPPNSPRAAPEPPGRESMDGSCPVIPHHHHTSFIKDIFGCTLMNELRCTKCGYRSQKADPCLDLSLDIPGATGHIFISRHELSRNSYESDGQDSYDAGSIHMTSSEYETSADEGPGPTNDLLPPVEDNQAAGDGASGDRAGAHNQTNNEIGQRGTRPHTTSATQKTTKVAQDESVASCRPCRLRDCLNSFTKCERLKVSENYKCESCVKNGESKSYGATKSLRIKSLPQVLCLQLKRFAWSMTSRSKIQRYVQFPLKGLDMSEYCTEEGDNGTTKPHKQGSKIFDLYAVIVHHGAGFGSGHYTAYCRNHGSSQWWHFNDSVVAPVDEEVVARAQAYLLFYEQVRAKA